MRKTTNLTERNYTHQQSIIINARYGLTKNEIDIVLVLLTAIHKDDKDFKDYEFTMQDLELKTGRAKCRNIWNWYDKRDWTYHVLERKSSKTEEEILMTRQERARSNAKAKAEKARKSVINAVTGLYADEYKKVNGAWHIIKISEATGLSRRIVSKYLKQWEANKEGMFEEFK